VNGQRRTPAASAQHGRLMAGIGVHRPQFY
jgi:hypothetical protein